MASTPRDSWFYLAGDQPVGPLSAEQLRAAVSAGAVRRETMIRNAAWPQWCQAGQVPGLLPSSMVTPPGQVNPSPPPEPRPAKASKASAPNEAWFYLAGDNKPIGPLSAEQLRAGVSAGAIRPETLVNKTGWPDWRQAGQVPGLFPAAPVPTPGQPAAPPPPQPDPAAAFTVQLAESNRPRKEPEGKKRKKKSSLMPILLLLVALVGCIGLAVGVWNIRANRRAVKRPVARVEKEPEEEPTPEVVITKPRVRPKQEEDPGFVYDPNWKPPEITVNPATFEIPSPPTPQGRIDELIFAKWKQLGIEPANQCSDAVFLRRAYLDVIGTLPTVQEAKQFLDDKSPDKRKKLVDALLERPEFADFWAMKWSDLLRVKAEFPINLWPNAAQAYHRWLRHSIKTNKPYDKFVRELLTSSGSNFRVPQVNFYRALQSKDPKGIARAVALTFMGTRAEKWPAERLDGLSAFFLKVGYKPTGEWKEEIVIFDPHKSLAPPPPAPGPKKPGEKRTAERRAKPTPPPKPVFPDGTSVEIAWDKDPRVMFADWLITPQNPWFARHIVNRVWYWLMGRGIVHEADDIRPDNPPSNPELLNYLAEELVKSKYDLKHIYRLILNSSTYQLSSIPKSKDPQAAVYFASYTVRRLEAEVIIDALNQITGTTESYSSIIPEPYTFIPETRRAIALPDGSVTSSFLELFGRPPRDSGMESERNNRITAGQRLHLLNSSHIRNKLRDGPELKKLIQAENASENVYLAILSRRPDQSENGSLDSLAWTLVNSTEFLFRH
jgi:hypothetical protein